MDQRSRIWLRVLPGVAIALVALASTYVAQHGSERISEPPGAPVTSGPRYRIPVSPSQPSRGPDTAPVVIVEWCEARSDACANALLVLDALLARHGDRVRHVYRHFVGERTPNGLLPHEFLRFAAEHGDLLWEARQALLARSVSDESALRELASELGLDPASFTAELARHPYAGHVAADGLFADRFGVTESPALFVNGRRFVGTVTLERVSALVEAELHEAEALLAAGVRPEALYDEITSHGEWVASRTAPASHP